MFTEKDRHLGIGVGLEGAKGIGQILGRGGVDRIAHFRR